MNTAENIKKIALIFFIILGSTHITSSLMVANRYLLPFSYMANRILEIPFAMIALIYGLTSIQTSAPERSHKIINIAIIAICFMVFAGLMYISIFIPDRKIL